MRLPQTVPIRTPGPPGFIQWLHRESQPGGLMPGVIQHVRSVAPHVLSQAALHGLGQDDVTSTFVQPTSDIWSAVADVPAGPSDVPAANPVAPGGQVGGWADTLAQVVTPLITGAEQIKLFNTQLALAQAGKPPLNTSQIRLPGVGVNFGLQTNTGLLFGGIAVLGVLAFLFGGRRRS
jgi:hypothetical protein